MFYLFLLCKNDAIILMTPFRTGTQNPDGSWLTVHNPGTNIAYILKNHKEILIRGDVWNLQWRR